MLWHEGGAGSKAVPATSGVNVSCNLQHATHFHGFCMKNPRTTTINLNSTCEQNFKVYSHAAYLLQKFPLHRSYRNACMCCRKRLIQCMEWKFQEHICHVWIYFDFLGFVHTTLFSVGKIGYGSTTEIWGDTLSDFFHEPWHYMQWILQRLLPHSMGAKPCLVYSSRFPMYNLHQ